MNRLARVVDVEHLGEHRLRLTFSDEHVRELDFANAVQEWARVFELLSDPAFFAQLTVDPVAGTVARPNGVDLDPDLLHGDHAPASGRCHGAEEVPPVPD